MGNTNLKSSIIELRKGGKTINEIVETLGCAKSTVSYHINKENLGGVTQIIRKKITDEEFILSITLDEVNLIVALKKQGRSYKDIRDKLDISYDKIKRICNIYGINKSSSRFKIYNESFINDVKRTYDDTKSLKKTAKLLNSSFYTIKKIIGEAKRIRKTKKVNNSKAVTKHRQSMKAFLVEYKGGHCELCGYNKSLAALTFHHLNPEEKEFTIGGKNYSKEKMVKEVDKCILVCHNCHCEIHEKERELA